VERQHIDRFGRGVFAEQIEPVGRHAGRLVAAEQTPLPESLADAIELLEKALNVARNDVKDFNVAFTPLKLDTASEEDFTSAAAAFLEEIAG
jgi:hypothetical protein